MRREGYIVSDENGCAIHKGLCRRSAPACQVLDVAQLATPSFARWPVVFANDWCGEFASRTQRDGDCQYGGSAAREERPSTPLEARKDTTGCHSGKPS